MTISLRRTAAGLLGSIVLALSTLLIVPTASADTGDVCDICSLDFDPAACQAAGRSPYDSTEQHPDGSPLIPDAPAPKPPTTGGSGSGSGGSSGSGSSGSGSGSSGSGSSGSGGSGSGGSSSSGSGWGSSGSSGKSGGGSSSSGSSSRGGSSSGSSNGSGGSSSSGSTSTRSTSTGGSTSGGSGSTGGAATTTSTETEQEEESAAVDVPEAPAAPELRVDADSLLVSWTAPADGGAPITGYSVALDEEEPVDVGPEQLSHVFEAVGVGEHSVHVVATNEAGDSAPSEPATTTVDEEPLPVGTLTVSGDLHPGGTITVTGEHFPGDVTGLAVEIHSVPTALAQVDTTASGTFELSATLPDSITPGEHTVVVRDGEVEVASTRVVVVDPPGGSTTLIGAVLLGLAALGGGALALRSRRRRGGEALPDPS